MSILGFTTPSSLSAAVSDADWSNGLLIPFLLHAVAALAPLCDPTQAVRLYQQNFAQAEDASFVVGDTDYLASGPNALDFSLDSEGRKTTYSYDDMANPRLVTTRKVFQDASETEVLRWEAFIYDAKGRLLTETLLDSSDGGLFGLFRGICLCCHPIKIPSLFRARR